MIVIKMDQILRQLVSNALNFMVYDQEKKYLMERFGCKKTSIDLCRQLRHYQSTIAPAPRLEDFIRHHYHPCEESCEYYLPHEIAYPALVYGLMEYGELVVCQKLYSIAMIHAVEGHYPTEFELMLYQTSFHIDLGIQQLQREFDQPEQKVNNIPDSYVLEKNSEQRCCMCQEGLHAGQRVITLPCMHTFHCTYHQPKAECVGIEPWLATSKLCPLCKQAI